METPYRTVFVERTLRCPQCKAGLIVEIEPPFQGHGIPFPGAYVVRVDRL